MTVRSIVKNNNIVRLDDTYKYLSIFDPKTGNAIRSNVFDGSPNPPDPFMSSYPELIDIGIMGRCKNADACTIGCYQGKRKDGQNMSLENYKMIIDQAAGKVQQVALGGAGSPNEHENYEEILKYTRESGIVPNFTTSGIGLTARDAAIAKEYCGAVAVSYYKQPYTFEAIRLFKEAGIQTNIHFVLSKDSLEEAIDILEKDVLDLGYKGAIVFLTHKPVGCGSKDQVLELNDNLKHFIDLAAAPHKFGIGFDSCFIPTIIASGIKTIPMNCLDTCEGARFSCYIAADMYMTPCSFDQKRSYGQFISEDLSIYNIWNHSAGFKRFRNSLEFSCPECPDNKECMGGCPIVSSIVPCSSSERVNYL